MMDRFVVARLRIFAAADEKALLCPLLENNKAYDVESGEEGN